MKKLVTLSVLLFALLSLSACASMSGGDPIKVKCPSCGYEFDVERYGS
jgi:predicted small secreted protein